MKKNSIKLIVITLTSAVMIFSLSCKDETENPTLSLYPPAPSVIEFAANGVNYTNDGLTPMWSHFIVQTNQWSWDGPPDQNTWDAQSNKSWLTITKHYTTLVLRAAPAGPTPPEPAELTITAGNAKPIKIRVTQLAATPAL